MKYLTIALLLSFIFLTGCNTKPIKVSTQAVKKAPIVIPSVDIYNPRKFEWIIITPENAAKVFKKLGKKGQSIAIFGLSADGYEALSLNSGDTRTLIQQLNAQLDAYKKYYLVVPKAKTPETPKSK